jgi:carbamoyltransferase
MYILGINISHHASIALLKDGELLYYLEDDRISRKKEQEWVLDSDILCLKDILKYTNHLDHVIFASYGRDKSYYDISDQNIIDLVKKRLGEFQITYDKDHWNWEHHLYHACTAFYSSGFDEAAALILDGGGVYLLDNDDSREVESMYYFPEIGKYDEIKKVYDYLNLNKTDTFSIRLSKNKFWTTILSCGALFNKVCCFTDTQSPGKTMGLSPYGNIDEVGEEEWFYYDSYTDSWLSDNKTIFQYLEEYYGRHKSKYKLPEDSDFIFNLAANLSKKLQEETKKHTIKLIKELIQKTGTKNVVLSGGYFLNCVNNYEYIKEFPEINFFIDPTAHDGGTSIGAAKYVWHHLLNNKTKHPLQTLFLGG